MTLREIVQRYDAGRLSTTDVLAELERYAKLPLSEGQRALWALHKMEPDGYPYNVPVCLSCHHVDQVALGDAFRDTVSRHPILSATVQEGDDGPYLAPGDADSFRVEYADISDVPSDDVLEHLKSRAHRPFDLANEPLIRLSVLPRAESEIYVLVVVHHIILDGPSLCVVLDTLLRAYQARIGGGEPPSQPSSAAFDEFVAREREYLGGARAERDRDFWKRELTGTIPLTGLPTETTLAPDAPHEGEVCTRRLSKEQFDAVTSFAAANEIIPGVFLLAVFKTLLHRYTGQEDIVIGMPVSGRPPERFDSTVGYFVNVLPIRSKPVESDKFTVFAQRLQATVFEAIDHGAYPFHHIVRDLGGRDDLRSPVFQVAYNYQNYSISGQVNNLAGEFRDTWSFRAVDGLRQLGEYDLKLDVIPDDGFELAWKYHPAAFSAATIARMADHFVNLIDDIVASDGHAELGRLSLLDEAERRVVLDEWNHTDVDYPENQTVWDLFAERAGSDPDQPAVACGEQTLTYRELADRSSALADALRRRGVEAGDRVGVCFERSLDLIVGLLAIMKQGAAYVPLDPGFPAQRLSYMIQDSGAELVVCHEAVVDRLSAVETHGARLYVTDRPDDSGNEEREPRVARQGAADPQSTTPAVAHIIYTSGSTGQPKGVVIPHRALTNFLLSMARMLDVTSSDRLLAIATYSFDIAALELYLPLITGGRCRICDSTTVKDATLLAAEIEEWRPTVLQATPTTWAMLVRVGWQNACGAKILTGGEALPENLKDQLMSRGEVWNLWGPTETTIYSSGKRLRRDEPLSVGMPIANTQLYVLDKNMQPLPVGVPGEVCISGHGLALGYHGKPDLTADRFVENPFVRGQRMYRSGDVARRLPNGEIAILGRMDNQVKLRGYRIELGEIETALNDHPVVAQSVVAVENKGSSKRLTAYFTVHDNRGHAIDTKTLRAHLEKILPAYMVPSAFVALESFPHTANGKIDRARLGDSGEQDPAARERPASDTAAGAPHVERGVRRIFREVLGRDDVDRDEGFFDLGGDSFTAIGVVENINRTFGCQLRPTTLFIHSSIAAMTRYLEGLPSDSGEQDPAAREPSASDTAAGTPHVERGVRRIFREVLGREDVDRDEGFFDLGGDSFTAIGVVENINRTFGCQLRPTTLFIHSSIAAMTRHLEGLLPSEGAYPARAETPRTPRSLDALPNGNAGRPAIDDAYLDDSVAVVGMSCQFPGAANHREFWRNLREGRGSTTSWSPEELRAFGVPDELIGRSGYVPLRSVIDGKAEFDPAFFGISPRDAELMDPQGRLLLLHAWKALEDAGYRPEDVPNTSVFTSTSNNFYQALLQSMTENASGTRILASTEGYAAWLFSQGGSVPTMISSKLGLSGPSMAVSTNCSSALSGIHLACQGLLSGEVDQALVGAASLYSMMELGYVHQPGLNFSSDGRCRAFDDAADGMTGGEGVGVVVVKRARDAFADGDHVYCLIRGMAVNNDGGDKAGFYAPSVRGQADVISRALDRSGVNPESIRYVEAHGTGTKLGDPIEVAALTEAYRHHTSRSQYCGIGSVKSNIGHLDAAAGIASLIKLALGLHHGEIPRTLHCDVPNTEIDWENSPFYVATRNVPLDARGAEPARVGLSAFGIGGTNVHAVLEQAGRRSRAMPSFEGPHLVVLSARDDERLVALARELLTFLPEYRSDGEDLASLVYTLQVGRRAMASRIAFVANDFDRLTAQLRTYVEGRCVPEAAFAGGARRDDDELVSLFSRTEQLKELTAEWIERGSWEKIAPLWVSGVAIDWNRYYGAKAPERVSLPTYPFDTKVFWPSAANERDKPAEPVMPRQTRHLAEKANQLAAPGDGALADAEALLADAAGADGVERFLVRRQRITAEMNGVLRQLLLAQLWEIGLFREPVRREQIGEQGAIGPSYAKWLDHSVNVLVDGGELVRDGELLRTRDGAPNIERTWRTWHEWKDAHANDPELSAKATMTERILEAMPAILTGKSAATTVLFPGGSFEFVEAVYSGNIAADYFHRVLAGSVRSEVERRRGGARSGVRILEVGGGTGSASKWIFEQLEGFDRDVAEYCFTDISKAFLIEAENRFSPRFPYLTYKIFNAERAPDEQGLEAGQYDIVIANNVLHTTRDIVESVGNAKALLRPGGVLLLNEVVDNEFWAHLALGLLDGWFRYTDGWRIDGGPALSSASWRHVLRERGFDSVQFPTEQTQSLGLRIIVARVGLPEPVSTPIHAEPEGSLETHVEEALAQGLMASLKLRRDELKVDAPFADYGLDSLTGVNLVRMLNESLGTDLDPSVLFDNPSVRRLTTFLLDEHRDEITAHRREHGEEADEPQTSPAPAAVHHSRVAAPPVSAAAPVTEAPPGKEPIAIIGMSGRFPGARNVDEFWSQLVEGHDPVTPVSRWDLSDRQSRCGHGGFLDGIEEFDPLFFGISGVEASYMEPQQRLFLQEAWNALEDAGHAGESVDRERCGIYVGCADGDYFDLTTPSDYPAQAFWGNMNSMVPSRLAYYLDLHGPAMTVNTACSSSLTSVYLACQGLWTRETDLALAGGVAIQCSPRVYIAGSRAGMLAPSGRCRSFDQDADGFVPAEGVGVVVLKRLSDAEADGDHIYGVVRGIGANQDGTSNGITAPNGNSQEKLIRRIYRDFEVDPESIQVVEAHGTGTKLGDPVEFNALARAFRAFTSKEQFCSLGSVKANIGHAGEAAGIAGIIKTLLAMKHGAIPGLLHYRTANASITLEGSPFFVHTEPREWVAPHGGKRRAAITSLGASGTNVHVVVEEPPASTRRSMPGGPRLIALSARTREALREQVTRLARHCREHRDLDLGEMSYTLLLGRGHFEHRWACVAGDVVELERRLAAWLSGESGSEQSSVRASGTDTRPHVLAAEYLDGQTPSFEELFRDGRYRRMSLPGYPFERSRYTLPSEALPSSDSSGQHTMLTGDEFYLREHRVRGTAIVPGAMYLQWAYAAVQRAGSVSHGGSVCLHDIAFLRPLSVTEGPRAVRTALRSEGSQTRFEVHSTESSANGAANAGGESVIHCQGGISYLEPTAQRVLDLPAMLRDFRRSSTDPERFYTEYRERGIDYGPALQGCVAVYETGRAVLAELKLPEVVADTVRDLELHPALVDSAMQCMRLLVESESGDNNLGLVFSIKKAEILAPCSAKMWAWVRRDDDARGAERIDIDLADDSGKVCLTLRGIMGRGTTRTAKAIAPDEGGEPPAVTLLPTWDPTREVETEAWPRMSDSVGIIAATQGARDVLAARYPSAHVLAVPTHGSQHDIDNAIRSAPVLDHLIWVAPEYVEAASGDRTIGDQSAGTLHVFRTAKALLAAGYGNRQLGWSLITHRAHAMHEFEPIDPSHSGVAGLAGSIAKEYPNWTMRVADVDAYDTPSLSAVPGLPADPDGNLRIRRNGMWYRQQLLTVQADPPTSSRLREGGTYVIVGGAGGLGTAVSEYLIRRYRAQVVWLGRRPRNARIDAAIATAARLGGPAPHYLRADATSAESLRQAREEIERRFGNVHGVIHSGLVFSGGASLAKMTETEFHDVLRSKVDASVRLLDVFGGDSLDVVVFLSSIISYLKAIKQADYAAACTFMDSFAHTVERRYGCAAKVLNLGYCFNNAVNGNDRTTLMGSDVPLIQAEELTAAIELLCAGTTNQMTLMKFSPALNARGITVGHDEVLLRSEEPSPSLAALDTDHREPRGAFDDLARLRERVTELTALAI